MRRLVILLGLVAPALPVQASPNVAPDDPRYDELARREALGELPLYLGGFAPLTEARVRELLGEAALPRRGWLRVDRALVRGAFDRDRLRPYSTPVRPRDITGAIAVTCEHARGRPCVGSGVLGEVDGSAGWGGIVSGTLRLRAQAGSQSYEPTLAIDRAYVIGELGAVAIEAGRDVLIVGPRSRTPLGWGDHAPPLDHVRVSTARPLALGDAVAANVLYVVGRLREPQRYPDNLVTISRVQLELGGRWEVGAMQLLHLGGEGAAELGLWDFIAEHARRRDLSATETDTSNRRFGGDVSLHVHELHGLRLYYAVMFEDIRRARWMDAVRYDADHLFGFELAALGPRGRHGLSVEYHQTGVRSQEHRPRITGLTNAGRVVGAPLGPDARSLFARGRIGLARGIVVYPWFERAVLVSDTYAFVVDGPISRTRRGRREFRYRAGTRARVPLGVVGLAIEAEAIVERVEQLGFEPDAAHTNARVAVDVVYRAR